MATAYEQGFMDKCASRGIDPQALIKQAGIGKAVTEGADKVWKGIRRAGELLSGSKARKIERSKPNFGHLSAKGKALAEEQFKALKTRVGAGVGVAAAGGTAAALAAKKDK